MNILEYGTPMYDKALYRKAVAMSGLGQFQEALYALNDCAN